MNPPASLSVVIVAKNEEANIRECLESVPFTSEIILVDDFSTDNTTAIAELMGAKVFQRALAGNWGSQQTFAISHATKDWILLLDCDERITPELGNEIQEILASPEEYAYAIKRINHFCRKRVNHGVLRPDYVSRLMPRQDVHVTGLVHPQVVFPYTLLKAKNPMLHYAYDSWDSYFNKFNHYTRLAAQKSFDSGKSAHYTIDIIFRPLWAFLNVYVFHGGFLDGKIGWILSINHYFYTAAKYFRLYYLKNSVDS